MRGVSIFCLRSHAKVVVSPEPNEDGYKTYRVPSYDLDKKKIKKRFLIFWEVGEVRGVSIFRLGTVEEVELDCGWVEAGFETHRVCSYDLD